MYKKINDKLNNGITLIALVITIVVLLILAGITISMLSGENGILKQATNAKTETDQATIEEQIRLAIIASMTNPEHRITNLQEELDNQLGGGKAIATSKNGMYIVNIGEKEYRVDSNGEVGEIVNIDDATIAANKNRGVKDANGETFVIPANFKLAKNEDGKVIEDEITKGIVIEDSEDNQYVWIPVFEKTDERTWGADYSKVTSEDDWSNIKTALKTYTTTYANSACSDEWYGNSNYGEYGYYAEDDTEKTNLIYYTNGNMSETEYETLYHNMLKSVYKNGGFYIGRYEMGIEVVNSTTEAQNATRTRDSKEYEASSTNSTNEKPTIEGMTAPISKPNAVPYNRIKQSQAQMLAQELGKENDYSNVTTSIMFGVQWDIVCVFIERFDENEKKLELENQSDWLTTAEYSKLWANYNYSTFNLNRGYYSTNYGASWVADYTTVKNNDVLWFYTTGASDQNKSLNIYDFAGHLGEFTLERYNSRANCVISRGGYASNSDAYKYYASIHQTYQTFSYPVYFSSRVMFCI